MLGKADFHMLRAMTKTASDIARAKRIKAIRTHFGNLSQTDFAKEIGRDSDGEAYTRGAVGNWELGGGIKLKSMAAIAARWAVSVDWIATGVNPPDWYDPTIDDIEVTEPERISIAEAERVTASDPSGGYFEDHYEPKLPGGFPEIDGGVGAGEGQAGEIVAFSLGNETYSAHKVVAEWVIPDRVLEGHLGLSRGSTIVMRVEGDSMEPTFRSGDRVFVDTSRREVGADGIYVFTDGFGEPKIKHIERVLFSNPARVRIISSNPVYSPIEVDAHKVIIIGRVAAMVQSK